MPVHFYFRMQIDVVGSSLIFKIEFTINKTHDSVLDSHHFLCQKPKLAPYIPAMREKLAEAFGMPLDAVSVKATTEEHLGFTGEGLGIAVHAVALIETL